MAFILLQGGTSLQLFNQSGELSTLTLPTGITLQSDRPPRFAVFNKYLVMVNTPTRPITIDAAGIVRVLCPRAPELAVTLATTGGSGGLSGSYKARQTFRLLDDDGNLIAESDMSPIMDVPLAIAGNTLDASVIGVSQDAVSSSQLYRTTSGGAVYFPWLEVDGNVVTASPSDDTSDASLSLVAAPVLGTPPNLSLIASFRDRLWGIDRARPDHVRYTEAGQPWSWPASNDLPIGREGADSIGVTALIARRDALGAGRRDGFYQITGTTNADFRVVVLSEQTGVESQETVVVQKDVAYFLGKDGVYTWSADGIKCISDGKVRAWFNTDTYFKRSRFPNAFAGYDPINSKYRLFLADDASSVEDRWVEYDTTEGTWWGPHLTSAVTTLTSAMVITDGNDRASALIGDSTGFLWKDQSTATDNVSTGIAINLDTKFFSEGTPDLKTYWGELTMIGKVQSAGTITITPKVGYLNASAGTTIPYDLTKGRHRLRRLGTGNFMQLNFTHSTAGEPVEIYGMEVPTHPIGRR